MKKIILICCFLAAFSSGLRAQDYVAVKTNAVGWAFLGTINAGAEVALFPRWTVALDYGINPWEYGEHKQSKFWTIQPELRFWFNRKFDGAFIGLHYAFSDFDYAMNKYRYDGRQTNFGLSGGYTLRLSERWRVEGNFGLGWVHRNYEKESRYQYPGDVVHYGNEKKDLFHITRAGLSLIFVIK